MKTTKFALIVLKALEHLECGELHVVMPDGTTHHFKGEKEGPVADITVRDWSVFERLVVEGDVGFGETYMLQMWETEDLENFLLFANYNLNALEQFFHGNAFFRFVFGLLAHFKRNTKKGSRRNIFEHYDLGNDFYSLWLDETMTYSSALYDGKKDKPLHLAQRDKYHRILERLGNPGETLEIGCGWGGFSEAAALEGFHVNGITISNAQAEYATARLAEKGLANKTSINIRDYRDTNGTYDHIVSIEMFEAVGKEYWDTYFSTIKQRLSDKGKAVIQTITIHDDLYELYINRGDFIRKHIFPGGLLPSASKFKECAEQSGLVVTDSFNFGHDYAQTLHEWLEQFDHAYQHVKALGFSDEFIRKWRFYLAVCISRFAVKGTDVYQFELQHA